MKKLVTLAAVFILSIPLGLVGQDETFYPYSFARLSYVNGDVYVQRGADLGYEKGEVNLALVQGDKMGIERGQAEIHFGRRNYLRLGESTRVEFAVLPREGEDLIKIHLLEGQAYLRISALVEEKGVEIHTPDASFYVLEEGLFRFNVKAGRMTEAFAHEGSLEAAAEGGSVAVRTLESVSAANGRLLRDPDYFYSRSDGFDDWNRSRDSLLARRNDRRYLPRELDAYEEELEGNGNWVYERPYGYVWVPIVYQPDWRPYLIGRWVWYPVIGWTWVSSEPWGWAVYHYGRWHWRIGLGWYWIPHHHWRPAWVHWWWDGDYIGWCPLGWYNRPIVVINNYFYDRHFDSHFPASNRALTVVHRNQLQAPQVHKHQLGQTELSRISKVALKAQQPPVRPAVNSAGPQAVEARRVLSARPGEQAAPRNIPPSRSLSPSRLSPRDEPAGSGAPAKVVDPSPTGVRRSPLPEGALDRPAGGAAGSPERSIRFFPSQRTTGLRDQTGNPERQSPSLRGADAGTSPGAKDIPTRVPPTIRQAPSSSKADPASAAPKLKRDEGSSSGAEVKKGEAIKNYPSMQSARPSASSLRPSSYARTTAPRSAAYPSRLSPGIETGSNQGPAVPSLPSVGNRAAVSQRSAGGRSESYRAPASSVWTPSSRTSGSLAPSRSGFSGPSAPSSPRSSYSPPSRSGGPSGSSVGASRGQSSSGSSSRASSSSSSRSSGTVKKKG